MNERNSIIIKTGIVGIITNIFLAAFKAVIGVLSSSIAITLDAVNNLTDAISSIITIVGTVFSGKSPTKKHPFGYGRIEYLSTLAIALLILYAGITSLVESIKGIIHPEKPDYSVVMLIVIAVAVVVKVLLGLFFVHRGKVANSDSLSASGKDALFDAIISAATVITAILFMVTGLSLEAYVGIVISLLIIKAGFEALLETVSKILGEGADVELVKDIKKTIASYDGVNGAYDLIFNNYGQDMYIASVHIEIDETMSADQLDLLTRRITEDVHAKHGVILSAIGVYSNNTSNPEVVAMKETVRKTAMENANVHQIHGFNVDFERKIIRFDMVISFDEKDRHALYEEVVAKLKNIFPEYEISAGMDSDFNEI